VDERFFGESQSAAFDAIKAWYEAGSPAVCVVYGPAGAGKRTIVERLWRSLAEPDLQKVLVRAGRVFGAPFEHDVLAALEAGLWPDASPSSDDPRALRARLVNAIANWDATSGDPPLLLGLTGVDACADWPDDPGASVLSDLGPSVRVVLTPSGARSSAEKGARQLGVRPEHVAWVPVDAFRVEDTHASLRASFAWAAIDGPGLIPFVRALNHALREAEASGPKRLLSLLTRALAPLPVASAAELLGAQEAEVHAWLHARRGRARRVRRDRRARRRGWVAFRERHGVCGPLSRGSRGGATFAHRPRARGIPRGSRHGQPGELNRLRSLDA
jgi:hypothetical protein